jgi:hypothetical protein
MMEYAILAFMGRMTAYRQECRQVTLQRVCTTRHEHARDMSTPGKIPDREEVSTGVQEGGGGGESSGPGGGLRNLSSVPITMACGRVTRALLGCMLMLATSLSMVVEEGDTNQVSLE